MDRQPLYTATIKKWDGGNDIVLFDLDIEVGYAFDIKDDLRLDGYRFNGDTKAWVYNRSFMSNESAEAALDKMCIRLEALGAVEI